MIDKLSYEEIEKISLELKKQIEVISSISEKRKMPELADFIATVEGYSKFLENTIEINKDADKALIDLKSQIK